MEIGLVGKALGGLAAGLFLGWMLWRAVKAGEQARASLAGEKAHTQGQIEADATAKEAEEAVQNAKANAGKNPTDW